MGMMTGWGVVELRPGWPALALSQVHTLLVEEGALPLLLDTCLATARLCCLCLKTQLST